MARFYGHFAAAYGTIWFALMLAAVVSQSQIDTGELGFYGFPVVALLYAWVRVATNDTRDEELSDLRRRVARIERDRGAL